MHTRIMIGVGAWLLGAVAATAGSLLAVSRLGQGIAEAPSQQLTVSAVNRALASEQAERPVTSPSVSLGGAASPITRSPTARPTHRHPAPSPSSPSASAPSPQPAGGTVLTSVGGTVVAGCEDGEGAYLQSWSPQQGYEATSVVRGPASTAHVVFKGTQRIVTMVVSCGTGAPVATTHVKDTWGGDE